MSSFATAAATMTGALRSGQIGTPVAARVVVCQFADGAALERLAAWGLEAAASWLNGRLRDLTAFGGPDCAQISALARFQQGQSALVSVGNCAGGAPVQALTVWGNRGVLSWEADDGVAVDAADGEMGGGGSMLTELRAALGAQPSPGAEPDPVAVPAPVTQGAGPPPWGVLLVSGDHTHQPGYAAALAADGRCRLIGLTDEADIPDRRRRLNLRLAQRLGIPVFDDLVAALQRPDVQIVSVCAEPARRGPIIVRAAEAGKHLYLDKPLAGSIGHARQVTAAVRSARVVSHMWNLVRMPPVKQMPGLLQSGRLGALSAIHFDLCFAKGHAGTARLGTARIESAAPDRYELPDSKRELTNVGVYPLTALLWLTGRRVRHVCASTGNYFFGANQANDMEDFGQVMLMLDDGTTATITAGRTGWYSHPSSGLHRTVLVGGQAAAVVDAHGPRVAAWADGLSWRAPPAAPDDPLAMWGAGPDRRYDAAPKEAWHTPPGTDVAAEDVRHFLDCIEHGRASDVSAELASNATEVLLAAYRSAATGEVTSLPLD